MAINNHYTEEQLLLLLKAGDEAAFTAFYKMYRELLLLSAYKHLRDVDDAMDVVQEIFIWVWIKRSSIDISGGIESYLWGAVNNRAADLIRKKVRARKREQGYMSLKDFMTGTDPLELKELSQALSLAIENISPSSREAFTKAYLENKSLKEIAAEMDINVQSAKNGIHRALKILREKFRNG